MSQAPLEFDAVHVDLSNKPRWYSKVNPRGLVPAVTMGGNTLLESLDICRLVNPGSDHCRRRCQPVMSIFCDGLPSWLRISQSAHLRVTLSRHSGIGLHLQGSRAAGA